MLIITLDTHFSVKMTDEKRLCSHGHSITMATETEIKALTECYYCREVSTHVIEICCEFRKQDLHYKTDLPCCTVHKEVYLPHWSAKALGHAEILRINYVQSNK